MPKPGGGGPRITSNSYTSTSLAGTKPGSVLRTIRLLNRDLAKASGENVKLLENAIAGLILTHKSGKTSLNE